MQIMLHLLFVFNTLFLLHFLEIGVPDERVHAFEGILVLNYVVVVDGSISLLVDLLHEKRVCIGEDLFVLEASVLVLGQQRFYFGPERANTAALDCLAGTCTHFGLVLSRLRNHLYLVLLGEVLFSLFDVFLLAAIRVELLLQLSFYLKLFPELLGFVQCDLVLQMK